MYQPKHKKTHTPSFPPEFTFQPPQGSSILDKDWEENYKASLAFQSDWSATKDPTQKWPIGIQIHHNKMYQGLKLCVPEDLVSQLVWEFHFHSGHIGIDRMMRELEHRYIFPP